jgi:hypothetical protein
MCDVATLIGKIVRFETEKKITAVVETEYGEALLDVNIDISLEFEIGDEVAVEDAGFYVRNGKIVTVVDDAIEVNGLYITWKKRK